MHASKTNPTRTSWTRRWLEGAGVGILLTLGLTWNQLSPTHLDLYHRLLPITTVVQAITLWMVLACILGTALISLLEKLDAGARTLLWGLFFAVLASRALNGLIVAEVVQQQGVTPLAEFLFVGGALLLLWLIRRKWYTAAIRGFSVVTLLLGFCILWVLPTLIAAGRAHQPRDQAAFRKAVSSTPSPHRRIVWLLFDEMSYDQTFVHRWPGLEMLNFDRLRSQSTTFSDVQPDGYFTERIVPSLFLGKPIADARSTSAGDLLYRSLDEGPWASFDGNATIFADAQRAGWTTGISGDYNPYCRMLKDQLDSCWMRLNVFGDHLSRDKTTWENFTAPAHGVLARVMHERFEPAHSASEIFWGTIDSARNLITDDSIDLVFVHLYLPHPPGFYNRKTGRVAIGGSYIDNMALADRTLGDLLGALAQMPSADRTTLVISSDHSWRVGIWRNSFGWTHEDELASGHGHFDPRPMLMVRFPQPTTEPATASDVSRPVPLLSIHAMLEGMIAGQIATPQQLSAWAAQQ